MDAYLTPGIYIHEVPSGARPIERVGTRTAAFIGSVGRAEAPIGVPTAVNTWGDFVRVFLGGPNSGIPMTHLAHAVRGFFLNGGSRCYVLDVGPEGDLAGTARRPGLSVLEEIDEVAIVAAPGYTDPAVYEAVIGHCELMRDRVAILDVPREVEDIMQLTVVATRTGNGADGGGGDGGNGGGGNGGEGGAAVGTATRALARTRGVAPPSTPFAAVYWPWIMVGGDNPGEVVSVPPSGHMAGVWARTDAERGVHKAPANTPLRGAIGLQTNVTPTEHGELNTAGVNVIRFFTGEGIRPWGARTTARTSAPEWRYISVRRLFCAIEEAIVRGTSWIVFEPNDRALWSMIRRDVSDFLMGFYRDGALMGATPEEAFFVQCDPETNPPDAIDAGQVTVRVGIAPVKPAEFVIFQISQYSGGAGVERQDGNG